MPRVSGTSPRRFNCTLQRGGHYTLVSSANTGGTTVVDVNMLLAGHSDAGSEIAWAKPEGANANPQTQEKVIR